MNKIYVVGMGPGAYEDMTIRAMKALESCQVIVGYTVYIDLLRGHFPEKEFLTTPMRKEVNRCKMAFEEAINGRSVAMVCSGDSGIYGMASLMYEVGESYPEVELEIIPGVTAALGGSSLLGAPLSHDCCILSLSDLLTPWEVIEKRLVAASSGDLAIAIYNPSSKKRFDYLEKACDILLQYKNPETICGIVRNIAREGQESRILTLKELKITKVDMFTTVFVGNKDTKVIHGHMVTPRGYKGIEK